MFIPRLSRSQIKRMRRAGASAARTLNAAGQQLHAGLSLGEIDRFVRAHTAQEGGTPAQLGYHGFPASLCVSRNAVVCHGIPTDREQLQEGDVVNLDVTTCLGGFHGDTSRTFFVGRSTPEDRHLVETAERCLWAGIGVLRAGVRLGEVGNAIQALANAAGCSVVRDFGGHGIGARMHLPPHVHHHAGTGGPVLQAGMCLTIEPMINLGVPGVRILDDGWTVVTADGRRSAQFEHTLLVTETGCEVLTQL